MSHAAMEYWQMIEMPFPTENALPELVKSAAPKRQTQCTTRKIYVAHAIIYG